MPMPAEFQRAFFMADRSTLHRNNCNYRYRHLLKADLHDSSFKFEIR